MREVRAPSWRMDRQKRRALQGRAPAGRPEWEGGIGGPWEPKSGPGPWAE